MYEMFSLHIEVLTKYSELDHILREQILFHFLPAIMRDLNEELYW